MIAHGGSACGCGIDRPWRLKESIGSLGLCLGLRVFVRGRPFKD